MYNSRASIVGSIRNGGQARTQLAGRAALAKLCENGSGGCMELWPGPPHLARQRDCTAKNVEFRTTGCLCRAKPCKIAQNRVRARQQMSVESETIFSGCRHVWRGPEGGRNGVFGV